MEKIILHHGSERIIKTPTADGGKKNNDYGQGFYCTQDIEIAKEWASFTKGGGVVNTYSLDLTGLKILNLNDERYSVLHWMAVLLTNRTVNLKTPVEKLGAEYLCDMFAMDTTPYDVITGYRADDSYFAFARAFITNQITLEQLEHSMNLGNLGIQYFIQGAKAFSKLEFVSASPVDDSEYFYRRNKRDKDARDAFDKILNQTDLTGRYLVDILRDGL